MAPPYRGTPDFPHGRPDLTGVLLVNLGTPDAPTPAQRAQVRRGARRASVLLEDRYRGDEIGSELAMEFPAGFAET